MLVRLMRIERRSPRTGAFNTMELPITPEQWDRYKSGGLIQRCFPQLTPAQREFIKTGYTQEDWDAIFPPDEEN